MKAERWMRSAVVLMLALVLSPASAQAPSRPARIGIVGAGADEAATRRMVAWKAIFQGLREQGFVEGRDFEMVFRFIHDHPERYGALTGELIDAGADLLIVPVCGAPLNAARALTRTIPIVVPTCNDDLVELGIVRSFNHPGGNVTGLSKLTPELAPKRLQLLLEAVPRVRSVAVLWNPAYAAFTADWRELRAAAHKLGVTLQPVEFRQAADLDSAFAAMARLHPDALIVFSDLLVSIHAKRVAALARELQLPAMFPFREVPEVGGLMSYGPNIASMWHQAARHVARILRGADPGELPIEQPTRFELVINLKTARAIGVTVPQELLLRADAVIE